MAKKIEDYRFCLSLKLINGGTFQKENGQYVQEINTCSIDYFLIIASIIQINHASSLMKLDLKLAQCFERIKKALSLNNWSNARNAWLNYSNIKLHNSTDNIIDWFTSGYEAFYFNYSSFQRFRWTINCDRRSKPLCKNKNRNENSSSFILK